MIGAVVVVTVLNILLGMLWYSPVCFGSLWAKAYKFEKKKCKCTPAHVIGSAIAYLVTALVISFFVREFRIEDWQYGVLIGFYFWLGFVATTHFSGVIWAKKPLQVYFIDVAYLLISLVMMTAIITAWQ